MKSIRTLLILLLGAAMAITVSVGAAGFCLSLPVHSRVGPPPSDLVGTETLDIQSQSGQTLRGWFISGIPGHGAVLLLHGVRSDRRQVIERMRFLHQAGYGVLAIDLQAHGESTGNRITFGALESLDALSAVDYLRARLPTERIGAIGISLGGAATLLGPRPLPVDALVLESVYPDIETAISDRVETRIGIVPVAQLIAKLFVLILPPILDIRPDALRPIDKIHDVRAPVLIMAGTEDSHTKIEETKALYAHAPEPKELWEISGAGHVDLQRFAGTAYNNRILAFFGRYLSAPTTSTRQ